MRIDAKLFAVLAMLVLALGVPACGGDDDGGEVAGETDIDRGGGHRNGDGGCGRRSSSPTVSSSTCRSGTTSRSPATTSLRTSTRSAGTSSSTRSAVRCSSRPSDSAAPTSRLMLRAMSTPR